jgi:hypothetical protein
MSRPLRSTPITGVSSLLRAGPPARAASVLNASRFPPPSALPLANSPLRRRVSRISTRLPTFRAEAADRTRAASMPDTAWPMDGSPPGSSRRPLTAPVLMSAACFDTSSAVRFRSPFRSPPDASWTPFSPTLTTTVFSQRSLRWFDASPRRATPKGHKTFIICTAPHQVGLPTSTSLSALVAHLKNKLRSCAKPSRL